LTIWQTHGERLYPRRAEALDLLLLEHRAVYDAVTDPHQSALSQWPYLRDRRNAYADLLLNASSLQHTLRRIEKACAAFFRRGQHLGSIKVKLHRSLPDKA
jgi:hypothetical protein